MNEVKQNLKIGEPVWFKSTITATFLTGHIIGYESDNLYIIKGVDDCIHPVNVAYVYKSSDLIKHQSILNAVSQLPKNYQAFAKESMTIGEQIYIKQENIVQGRIVAFKPTHSGLAVKVKFNNTDHEQYVPIETIYRTIEELDLADALQIIRRTNINDYVYCRTWPTTSTG